MRLSDRFGCSALGRHADALGRPRGATPCTLTLTAARDGWRPSCFRCRHSKALAEMCLFSLAPLRGVVARARVRVSGRGRARAGGRGRAGAGGRGWVSRHALRSKAVRRLSPGIRVLFGPALVRFGGLGFGGLGSAVWVQGSSFEFSGAQGSGVSVPGSLWGAGGGSLQGAPRGRQGGF